MDALRVLDQGTPRAPRDGGVRASLIVCTHDAGEPLDASRIPARADAEVVIVDAGRDPDRVAVNRALAKTHGYRHVHAPPPGLARQRNVGLREARARVVVFLDDDCVPRDGWFERLVSAVEDGATVATARVVTPADRVDAYTRAFDQDRGERSRAFTRADLRVLPPLRFAWRAYGRDASLAPWAVGSGSSFACDRARALALGGFREDLGPGTPARSGEEIDFFFRVLHAGDTARYVADAVVEHHHARRAPAAYLRTSHAYAWGGRAFLVRNVRTKPGYALVVLLRPVQLAGLMIARALVRDPATAAMAWSGLRGWLGLPPPARDGGGRA